MSENQKAPPPKIQQIDSTIESTAEDRLLILPLQQALETTSKAMPTSKNKTTPCRADWVNTLFADISGQLRRHSVIASDLFEGLLLSKTTVTGLLILKELVCLLYPLSLSF